MYDSCVTYFSGNWNNEGNAGTFQLHVNNSTSNSNSNITAHLLFSQITVSHSEIYCPGTCQNIKTVKSVLVILKLNFQNEDSGLENIKNNEVDMKRYGNLYSKIYDMDNLILAHKNARKDKLFYQEVKMVDTDPEFYLGQIQTMLKEKTYKVSEYTISTINDKGKERVLMKLPYFPDRIIQWAILLQVEEIFMKTFCTHTCASIKNRGIRKTAELTDKYMKDRFNSEYCLKIDVSKFYPNINHEIMKVLLRRKFKDKDLLALLDQIVDSIPGNKGVPIGSYLSQFLANFYLSYFDHWLKEKMKIKYVIRYMDDMVILHYSKEYLHWLKLQMDKYLMEELDLTIKGNWQVFPTDIRGIDFVGFRHFFKFKLLRKSTCKKFKRKMLKIRQKVEQGFMINYSEWCSANSYNGWLKWCDSFRLREKYVVPVQAALDRYYVEIVRRKKVKTA